MELKLESTTDHNEAIEARLTNGDEPAICILLSRLGNVCSIHLTPFETKILANAMIQMANRAEIVAFERVEHD